MKETLVLKNGEIIPLEAGGRLDALCVRSENRVSMVDIWEQLTEANLVEVKIKNGDGAIVGNYTDLILVSETSIVDLDGSVSTSFCLREKTEVEKRLDKLEAGQEVQNGAIGGCYQPDCRSNRARRRRIMGAFYGLRILGGLITLAQVPKLWKKMTSDWLDKNGRQQ